MEKRYVYSAPGRTEICGNHTDHQHGCVLAAAVDLETTAVVRLNGTDRINVQSEGYPAFSVDLNDLCVRAEELGTTPALVRGVAAAFRDYGAELKGFDAYVRSNVLPGSGLSSSAAFEVLFGTILNDLFFNNKLTPVQIAQIGQYAENVYFGKPCGLMDQMASAVGGMVYIDFSDPREPKVLKLDVDPAKYGYGICIIDTGADHADLTDEYSAIPRELAELCRCFGRDYLREVPREKFVQMLPEIRGKVSDRAILRAIHIYEENDRVEQLVEALRWDDFDAFLELVNESGRSSWMYLQNITPTGAVEHQEMALALAVCKMLLRGDGACRVHGGGFAGTIQAFVPLDRLSKFKQEIENFLGAGACHVLHIRSEGGMRTE